MHQQQPHQELNIPRERVMRESRDWHNRHQGKQLHPTDPHQGIQENRRKKHSTDRNEKWKQRDVGAFKERNVPENLGHSTWHCPFHQTYGLCHEQHINVFLACINMYCLRGKDRKRLKTHTPYIGISNIMTSLHLCPWIVVQSMHPGPQAPSRPW